MSNLSRIRLLDSKKTFFLDINIYCIGFIVPQPHVIITLETYKIALLLVASNCFVIPQGKRISLVDIGGYALWHFINNDKHAFK